VQHIKDRHPMTVVWTNIFLKVYRR